MTRLVVAAAARQDLREIARYTEQRWGAAQSRRYHDAIRQRFAFIGDHPMAGSPRDELRAGYRSVQSGRHIIFYRATAQVVEIVRILHANMDFHQQLGDD